MKLWRVSRVSKDFDGFLGLKVNEQVAYRRVRLRNESGEVREFSVGTVFAVLTKEKCLLIAASCGGLEMHKLRINESRLCTDKEAEACENMLRQHMENLRKGGYGAKMYKNPKPRPEVFEK